MSIDERCAVYFVREGYSTDTAKLLGRNAAGEGFIRAYLTAAPGGELACLYRAREDAQTFSQMARAAQPGLTPRLIALARLHELNDAGNVFFPGPDVGKLAWARRRTAGAHFSVCGITHTTASHGAMDAVAGLLSAPVMPWDALICTSEAVVTSMNQLLDNQEAYLRERLGATRSTRPQLVRIPLGVHTEDFSRDADDRRAARAALQLQDDEVAFLFVGRLSFHAKANPMPMYLALEAAARETGRRIVLVQAGWFANDAIERAFRQGAQGLCPSVRMVFADGRIAALRRHCWQAADVFISLSDNLQETYGLTPVEAMAAGLPCVVTDWDGYRDTVRDGVDGITVPTWQPVAGFGADLAARHEDDVDTYDRYIGGSSLFVAVDVRAATRACVRLVQDGALRTRLGETGRLRAVQDFDWRVVMARYVDLWRELARLRAGQPASGKPAPNPARDDPFRLYACYPTHALLPEHAVVRVATDARKELRHLFSLNVAYYAEEHLPSLDQAEVLINAIPADRPVTVANLLESVPAAMRAASYRWLLWLAKCGLVQLEASR